MLEALLLTSVFQGLDSAVPTAITKVLSCDLDAFPPEEVRRVNSNLASAHLHYLEQRVYLDRDILPIHDMIAEQQKVCRCYMLLWDIRWSHKENPEFAWTCSVELRKMIGEEMYLAGRLPDPVP